MRRFVVLSDLHVHPWSAFAKGDGLQNTRLRHTLRVLGDSLECAYGHDIPWVFGGDLVHTAGYALNPVLAGVLEILRRFHSVPKLAVWGNHDVRGVGGKITADQTVFSSVLLAGGVDAVLDPSIQKGAVEKCCGLSFSGAGYQPSADLLDYGEPSDVGVYHQTIRGSTTAAGHVLSEGIDKGVLKRHRISIVGHIHHAQQADAPEGQGILIPGSPEQHNFGDRGEHGWWIVGVPEEEGATPEVEFFPSNSPEFRTVDTAEEVVADDHYYRVRNVEEGVVLPSDALAVAPTPTTVESRDTLRDVTEVEQVLQAWLKEDEPEGDRVPYLDAGRELLVEQDPTRLRPVTLRRLSLSNFCSFEDVDLHVKDGMWLVTGKGKDYPSNGAGKSTLVGESLYWLLFGRTTKGLGADEVIRRGASVCCVVATFDEYPGSGATLEVMRTRDSTGPALRVIEHYKTGSGEEPVEQDEYEWEAASVNEMTAKLNAYLGITPEIYQNLAYFSQEKLLLFSSATDGERKNVLADLIGLSAYQKASEAAAEKMREAKSVRERWVSTVELLQEQIEEQEGLLAGEEEKTLQWKEDYKANIADCELALEEEKQKYVAVEDAQKQHAALLAKREDALATRHMELEEAKTQRVEEERKKAEAAHAITIQEKQEAVNVVEGSLLQEYITLAAVEEAVAGLPYIQEQMQMAEEAHGAATKELTEVRERLAVASAERNQLDKEYSTILAELNTYTKALEVGECPTCGQDVDEDIRETCLGPLQDKLAVVGGTLDERVTRVATLEKDAVAEEEEERQCVEVLERLGVQLKTLEGAKATLSTYQARVQEFNIARAAAAPLEPLVAQVEAEQRTEYLQYSQEWDEKVTTAQRRAERMEEAHTRKVKEVEERLQRVRAEENPHAGRAAQYEQQIQRLRDRVQKAETEVRTAALDMQIYYYWRNGFSKQGIQSLLVEEVATLFNRTRSDIFPLLTQGVYDVQFSTLSTTRGGELREKTAFVIYEHGQPVPYGTLSGGQRRRVDVGIMLVLAQAVSQWMGVRGVLGLLVLDEVFGFLDASGAEGLLAALEKVAEVVRTIYVITHDTHLQSLVPDTLRVEQDVEGVSRIQE